MTKYYLHDGQNQAGPFTIDELKTKGLSRDTQVWKEGTPAWVKAESLDELQDLFKAMPPPLSVPPPPVKSSTVVAEPLPSLKKNRAGLIVLLIVVLGAAATFFILNKTSDNDNSGDTDSNYQYEPAPSNNRKSTEEAEQDLGAIERDNPAKYLVVKGATFRRNLIGEMVLEGTIRNKAKVASFKDAVIEVEYLSVSNTVLDTEQFTKYETWQSGAEIQFKFKTSKPSKEVKQVRVTVVDAVAV